MDKLPTYFGLKMALWASCQHIFGRKMALWASCPKKYRLGPKKSSLESDEMGLTFFGSSHLYNIHLAECHFVILDSQRVINITDTGISKGWFKASFPLFHSSVDKSSKTHEG